MLSPIGNSFILVQINLCVERLVLRLARRRAARNLAADVVVGSCLFLLPALSLIGVLSRLASAVFAFLTVGVLAENVRLLLAALAVFLVLAMALSLALRTANRSGGHLCCCTAFSCPYSCCFS